MARHINLLDQESKAPDLPVASIVAATLLLAVLLTMGTLSLVAHHRAKAAAVALADAEARLRPIQEQLSQIQTDTGLKEVNAELESRVAAAQARLAARQGVAAAIQRGDVGSTQGFSTFMRAFARHPIEGLWLTGLELDYAQQYVRIDGESFHASGASILIRALRDEPAVQGRELRTLSVAVLPPPAPAAPVAGDEAATPAAPQAASARIYTFSASSAGALRDATAQATE